ncbi:MAG: hypothetical protein CVV47_13210 [Spirochaetae bacterium HGW-Spirochaetae-3]|jgi:hypothetical protein|nr:MAG: hypothetical protein CVV47_13210 [Spirochaetae bacterium HGW-Spirochaetae-3]
MQRRTEAEQGPLPRRFAIHLVLALACLYAFPGLAAADDLIVQRFSSERPDAELESVLYLTAGVALADMGYSSATSSPRADYILTTKYAVRGSSADVRLSLVAAQGDGAALATVDAVLSLGLAFDAELSDALLRLLELAALDRPAGSDAATNIGGLFSSDLITVADTMRTRKTRRVEALAYGGGLYFVGDFSSYARFGAGASLDAGILYLQPSWSLSAGPRATTTRAFLNEGVEGGDIYLSTLGLDLQLGVGAAQSQRLSFCASGGAAFITVAGDSGLMTKTVPYGDAGLQAGFPLGKDFFLGGDLRFVAIFEGSVVIMAVAPTVSLCKEF